LFIHEYTRRLRLSTAFVFRLKHLLQHQLRELHLMQTQEFRLHLNHWSFFTSRVHSDHYLRQALVSHTKMLEEMKQTLNLLGLQLLFLMEQCVYGILSVIGKTELDLVPRDVLEDILSGTDLYSQAVEEHKVQLRMLVLQEAHKSKFFSSLPKFIRQRASAVPVRSLMSVLAVHRAEMIARLLDLWISEEKIQLPVLVKLSSFLNKEESSRKTRTSQSQTCIPQSGLTQFSAEAAQSNLEGLGNCDCPSPSVATSHHASALPPPHLDQSSVEPLFQVLMTSTDLLAPLALQRPTSEEAATQLVSVSAPGVAAWKAGSVGVTAAAQYKMFSQQNVVGTNTQDWTRVKTTSGLNKPKATSNTVSSRVFILLPSESFGLLLPSCVLQRWTVGLLFASIQISTVWIMSKANQFLSSWSPNKFLLVTQGDLRVKMRLCKANHFDGFDLDILLHQAFSSMVLSNFSTDCKRMSGEIFERTMPSAGYWRPSQRMGFPRNPSEYASLAAQTVIGQVLEAVAPLSEDAHVQALTVTMTAFMEAWMEHILRQKIKFSLQGALQLKEDFDSVREMIKSDKYDLSAELHQTLLSLSVFQQVDSALLCLLQQPQGKPYLQRPAWESFTRCCNRDSLDTAAVGSNITNLGCVEGEELTQSDQTVHPPVDTSRPAEPYLEMCGLYILHIKNIPCLEKVFTPLDALLFLLLLQIDHEQAKNPLVSK
uniref:Coiled-coil protein 142 C-terminal domain-containing protein n=1 Tax=Xiphophorus couchianus TaxID=32473 RepID=A0A3B5KSI1_9TELE